MGPFLALLAALSFAFGSVLQQRGTLQTAAPEGDPRFLGEIVRKPVWLAGAACQALGWILQAAALNRAGLVVVQSLCTLSLVFALPLGAWLTGQVVSRRSVIGALLVLAGIIVFVSVGQPQSGSNAPDARDWWVSGLVALAVMALLAQSARRRRGAVGAVFFATAAGVCFAYQAAVTKVFVGVIGNGLGPILSSWTTWVLIVSALVGFAMQQSALKTGHLAPALAASNAATLVASVLLGVTLFDERITAADSRIAPAVVGLTAAVVGVVVLATPHAEARRDGPGDLTGRHSPDGTRSAHSRRRS